MKILNITHTDLDGIGCQLILELEFGRENIKVERCNYNNVNEAFLKYIESGEYREYNKIYITDISVSEEVAELIERELSSTVILLDHHKTAEWLNKYDWANVITHNHEKLPISASELVRSYFKNNNPKVTEIIKNINDYDTWLFSTNGNIHAKRLNDLCYMIGLDETLDYLHSQINNDEIAEKMKDKYDFLLEVRENEYKKYLESSNKSLTICSYKEYKVGVVIAERFISELGNDLAKLNPELDFIAVLNMRSGLSLRGIKEDIDLGLIAKEIGNSIGVKGGGHPRSSAISLTSNIKIKFVKDILKGGISGDI
ncbi:MAG: DHH family phosphoesterase [Clostridium chrysemydis]|uniref:DHH family phosphoesterase n=1 Tax=Clostridium chrysemydis TaxID=2665504 RepID=UPI003F313DAE